MTLGRFWLLMGMTLGACILFIASETLLATAVAAAMGVVLLASLWPRKRNPS